MTIDDRLALSPGIEMITGLQSWIGLSGDVKATIEAFVRMLVPRPEQTGPFALTDREYARVRYLAALAANRAVEQEARESAILSGQWAVHFGASIADLAALDHITPEQAALRYEIPERNRAISSFPRGAPGWRRKARSMGRDAKSARTCGPLEVPDRNQSAH